MLIVSVALGANFSGILSLTGLNVCYPIGLSLSDNVTSDDRFTLWGTLDAAATDASNAANLGTFRGGEQNLPADIWEVARSWPFLLVQRIAGSTAGSFIAAGDAAASPPVVSAAAPVVIGGYSAAMTLTSFSAHCVRIGTDRNMTAEDVFEVYVSEDATLSSATGALLAARICGGGGDGSLLNTVATRGYGYCVAKRIAGSTPGNILAYGPAPIGGGGSLSLTTLNVGNTAASGALGGLSAAASVDIYSSFRAVQITAGVRAVLPNPTDVTAGKLAFVMLDASSTQTLEMYSMTLNRGSQQAFEWTGSAWVGGKNVTPGGNALGASLDIGTTDAFPVAIIAGGSPGYSDDGTTIGIGRSSGGATNIQSGAAGVTVRSGGPVSFTPGSSASVEFRPRGAASGDTTELRLFELAAGGQNYTGFKAPDALAASPMYTLPTADATISGQRLASNAAGVLSWGGAIAVRATITNGLSISDGGNTSLTGWTEVTDSAAAFVPATGVFTTPTSGFYFITAELEFDAIAAIAGAEFRITVLVAGVTVASGVEIVQVAGANVKRNPKVCVGVQLTAGQTVSFTAQQNSGSGANTLTFNDTRNYMAIASVG